MRATGFALLCVLGLMLSGCYSGAGRVADQLNVYADEAPILGERNTNAISDSGAGRKAEEARHALEVLGSYRRAHAPQPYYPVVRPAEVRLMWVPDHLNRVGDLVPAHYYYLRVLNDGFEVQDAFDIERQLNDTTGQSGGPVVTPDLGAGGGAGTATPWVYKEEKR